MSKYFYFPSKYFFYMSFSLVLMLILISNPFLKYPYDMYYHLSYIDNYTHAKDIPNGRHIWHYLWAKFFLTIGINDTEIFLKAKIIHIIQSTISFLSIYFFSIVVIRNLFLQINTLHLRYLSLWSAIIWFTVYATHSMYYQLVWNLWYSLSYQITLPLFFYIMALTIILLFENTKLNQKIFYISQIIVISGFILRAHSMEFMYYLMYISVLCIIYIKELFYILKKYPLYIFISILTIIWLSKTFQPDTSPILKYISNHNFSTLYITIMQSGEKLTNGFNRSSASINELMYLVAFLSLFMFGVVLYQYFKHKTTTINIKIYLFILITSMFVLIPLFQFTGGLAAVSTKITAVNRFYYSSSLFLLLPISIYYLISYFSKKRPKILLVNWSISFLLFFTWLYSKNYNIHHHNYYKNITSIYNSFSPTIYAFNLSSSEIQIIAQKLAAYNKNNHTSKPLYFYARDDIAFVIKYINRENVLWRIHGNRNYIQSYKMDNNISHIPILFETPRNFTPYIKYK